MAVENGMYLTVWLPPAWSDQDTAALLTQEGIVTMPLSALTLATSRPPGLVLGYAGHSEAAMARVVKGTDVDQPRNLAKSVTVQ